MNLREAAAYLSEYVEHMDQADVPDELREAVGAIWHRVALDEGKEENE